MRDVGDMTAVYVVTMLGGAVRAKLRHIAGVEIGVNGVMGTMVATLSDPMEDVTGVLFAKCVVEASELAGMVVDTLVSGSTVGVIALFICQLFESIMLGDKLTS